MKKIFTLMASLVLALNANATAYKALYVEVAAESSAAGKVYVAPKKDSEDEGYIYDISDEEGATAFLKWIVGENSNGSDCKIGCTAEIPIYEAAVYVFPNAGYELVCYANKVKEDGIYTEEDCYAVVHGEGVTDENWGFDFEYTGNADHINVNNPDHPQDGHSSDGPSREEVYDSFGNYVSATPDTKVYVIFRKIGDELPKFVRNEETGIQAVAVETGNATCYSITGQALAAPVKGVNVINGKKVIVK